MVDGTQDGTSSPLTVDSAATAIAGLLSAQEDKRASEPQPPKKPEAPPAEEAEDAQDQAEAQQSEQTEQTDEGEESDEQEEAEEQHQAPQTHRIKINGEEVEVTLDEALKGYSRTQDYTRKTQALSEKDKALEAERTAVSAERAKYSTYLAQLEQVLAAPAAPDWDKLRTTLPPAEFAAAWSDWSRHQEQLKAVQAERAQVNAKIAEENIGKLRTQVDAERTKLREAIPEWKDPAVEQADKAKLVSYAKSIGFSDDDLAHVYDSRPLLLLRKAMLYDESQKQKPSIQNQIDKVKVMPPGSSAKKPTNKVTQARQRLAKTGRTEDAAAAIELMLD